MAVPTIDDYSHLAVERARRQPQMETPLVSVVTATLNSAATLERTIQSIHAQTASDIEHIVVDGGSTDGTLDIVQRGLRRCDYWLSERDRGISDAFNKGVALARGRYVQIMNADDWMSANQLESALKRIGESGADFAFGDLIFYENGKPAFVYAGDPEYARVVGRRMPSVGHACMLASRNCFERIGLFDLTYRCAMDYDWLLRLHRAGLRGAYCQSIVAHMTHDGVSNREFRRTIAEVRSIAIAHGRNPGLATMEAIGRVLKTSIAQPIKRHVRPAYETARRLLNPAYRPLHTADNEKGRAGHPQCG